MKNMYHLFSSMFFFFLSFCYATEYKKEFNGVEKKLDILGKITTGKDVSGVLTIDGDRAIIFDEDSHIINFKTNEKISILSVFEQCFYWHITSSFNNKKTFSRTHFALLDSVKGEIEKLPKQVTQDMKAITFSPYEKALYFCYGTSKNYITKYDYATKMHNHIVVDHPCYIMLMNPKEKMVYMADADNRVISVYEKDNLALHFKRTIDFPESQSTLYRYRLQGFNFVISGSHDIFIADLSKNSISWNCLTRENVKGMLIHPNGSVLIALFEGQNKLMCCWDIKTHEIICRREFDFDGDYSGFDISYDGLELIFKQKGEYIRVKTPYEMLYAEEKEKILYRLCVLQCLINEQCNFQNVPKDIERFCAQLLLQAFKR